MSILIKDARIIDPKKGIDEVGDILIEKGKIAKIGGKISQKSEKVIDAKGKIASPGFIDMHTHLREPGTEEAETIETGSSAALYGGFTTICAMPNTNPPCDSQANARFIIDKAKNVTDIRVFPVGTITKGRAGEEMSEMAELKEAGCVAFSDDGSSVADAGLVRHAMEYASMLDMLIIAHCEDKELAGKGVMHEGYTSTVLGLLPIPSESESLIVDRDIQIAELADARLHIAHVSAKESVELIRAAKKRGVKVTAEVTPHHLSLADEEIRSFNTNLKVNPPLRSKDDIAELKKGLKDGTIDVIATDHAPHAENQKEKEFDYAPFGMIGLETALPIAISELIHTKMLTWPALIAKLTSNPAKILKISGGTLTEGERADITIIDPEAKWCYDRANIKSKSKNSPFIGREFKGKVTDVIAGGKHHKI